MRPPRHFCWSLDPGIHRVVLLFGIGPQSGLEWSSAFAKHSTTCTEVDADCKGHPRKNFVDKLESWKHAAGWDKCSPASRAKKWEGTAFQMFSLRFSIRYSHMYTACMKQNMLSPVSLRLESPHPQVAALYLDMFLLCHFALNTDNAWNTHIGAQRALTFSLLKESRVTRKGAASGDVFALLFDPLYWQCMKLAYTNTTRHNVHLVEGEPWQQRGALHLEMFFLYFFAP